MVTRRLARPIAGAMTLTLVVGLAGCASREPAAAEPTEPGGATSAAPAPALEPEDALLARYEGFREFLIEAYADPDDRVHQDQLEEHAEDPLRRQMLLDLRTMLVAGVARTGRPAWDPAVVELQLDSPSPSATIRDCVDATDWGLIARDTGAPVAPDDVDYGFSQMFSAFPAEPHVVTFDAELFDEPRGWLLVNGAVARDEQC